MRRAADDGRVSILHTHTSATTFRMRFLLHTKSGAKQTIMVSLTSSRGKRLHCENAVFFLFPLVFAGEKIRSDRFR